MPATRAFAALVTLLASALPALADGQRLPAGRWYATQLHCHSRYSDGFHNAETVARWAREAGLDAVALTDHNTVKHLADPIFKDPKGPIMIPAYEWGPGFAINTKEDGERCHASIWGVDPSKPPLDVMLSHKEMMVQAKKLGYTVGVNHPFEPRFPWPEEDVRGAQAMEVWQWDFDEEEEDGAPLPAIARTPHQNDWGGWAVRNGRALEFWQRLMRNGTHVTPIASADFHVAIQRLDTPCTLIWSTEPTAKGLLAGIRAGHVALVEGPKGARVEAWADRNGDGQLDAMAGDTVSADGLVKFHVVGGCGQILTVRDADGVRRRMHVPTDDWWEPVSSARGFVWARLDRPNANWPRDRMVAMSGAVYLK